MSRSAWLTARDATVDRRKDAVAIVTSRHFIDDIVEIHKMVAPAPAEPSWCVNLELTGQTAASKTGWSSPTWSPDGRRIAFDDGQTLHVSSPIDVDACDPDVILPKLTWTEIPGAVNADWGPADVPAAPEQPKGPDGPRPADGQQVATGKPAVARTGLRKALRSGLTVRLSLRATAGATTLAAAVTLRG